MDPHLWIDQVADKLELAESCIRNACVVIEKHNVSGRNDPHQTIHDLWAALHPGIRPSHSYRKVAGDFRPTSEGEE